MLPELPSLERSLQPGPRAAAQASHRRYWLALYHRDVAAAQRVVDAAARAWPPQRVYLRLFAPALALSGTLWERGSITHQDEHFVTHHTQRFMRQVRRRFVPPPGQTTGPLAVVSGVGQESHLIGLRMCCDFLAWAHWRIHWLTSNDRGVAGEVVERLKPDAVLLSIGRDNGVVPAARMIADLRRRRGYRGLVLVGGRAINCDPSLVERLGADLTAPNCAALVRLLRPRFPRMGRRRAAEAGVAGE
jgi:methanogenic corrinoid protein MtbC1